MKRYALLACLLACAPVSAAQFSVQNQTINTLATGWGAEGFYVVAAGELPAGANCGSGNNFVMQPGHPMQREIVALLLAAMQSKKSVNIFVDGCVGGSMKLMAVSVSG